MFFLLSKTLYYLTTPAGWLFAILCYAVITKNRTHQRRATAIGLLAFCLLGNSFLANTFLNSWELPNRRLPTDTLARVGVVLTGGITHVGHAALAGQPLLASQGDRPAEALYLYRKGIIRTIIISGATNTLPMHGPPLQDEGQTVARFLQLAGVRPADIVLEGKSRNTHENAQFSGRVLRQRFHTDRCVLITSAVHMRRAEGCFRKQGIQVSPFSARFIGSDDGFSPADMLPSEEALGNTGILLREVIGYLTYRLMGYC